MVQKLNFLKKIMSAGLVTASTIAMVSASTAAVAQSNRTTAGAVTTVDGVGFDQDAHGNNAPVAANAVITANANNAIDFNAPAWNLNGLFLDTANDLAVNITQDTTLGFITNVTKGGNFFNVTLGANKTLAITGQGITAAAAAATVNAKNVVTPFNAGAAINNNDLSGMGTIDYGAGPSVLTFNLANPTTQAAPLVLNAKVAANGANGTLNITSGFIQVSDKTFATINKINISDNQGFILNTDPTAGNALNLQVNGATINFNGPDGTGKLVLLSKAGGATDFNVTGSLGGAGKGITEFNTTAVAGQLIANAGVANAVIGTNNADGRAAGFIVTATAGNAATINGQVYAKNITMNSGVINFGHVVDVGVGGTTLFKNGVSTVTIAQNSNLGVVDFGNTASQINVDPGMTLTGNFTGDANNNANTAGVITFAAAGTLASASTDSTIPVTNKIVAIEAQGNGAVVLSGTHNAELRVANAQGSFVLTDGTVINGGVNQTAPAANALAAGNLVLAGNAKITGNIGGIAVPAVPLGNITLANDTSKTLELGGENIIGDNGAAINFQANGGTVKIVGTGDNIVLNYNLALAADQKGLVDASSLTNAQTLTIGGTIGNIAANKSLAQLNVGGSKTILNAGDAAINELVIGDGGSVQLSYNNYRIARTTNATGQGKIIFAPTINNNGINTTNLIVGTNLGSVASPLAEISFAAPTAPAVDVVVDFGKGVSLYANNITTVGNNSGSFNFNAGGTNIVSGTVGTPANQFKSVTLANATTAQFVGDAVFNATTKIGGNSTLQIGGNYTADSIVANGANDTGVLQFVNTKDIIVTLNQQNKTPANALTAIKVSGGNVAINERNVAAGDTATSINTQLITFADKSLGSSLSLPSGTKLDGLTIASTVGNKAVSGFDAPRLVISGVDSKIANGQALGDQNNLIGLRLASDNVITVDSTTLYAVLDTVNDNQGTIVLNGGNNNIPGTIYSLGAGIGTSKLKLVTVNTNYKNLGNTIVTNLIVDDGLTYTAGGVVGTGFDGKITLGSKIGNSNVVFASGTDSSLDSSIVTVAANKGTVTYQGNALVGNIGSVDTPVAFVQFTGAAGSNALLQGAIYSQATDFNGYDLNIVERNVTLGGGRTAINGKIDLGTNILTFASGVSAWGSNTSIDTQLLLEHGSLGQIVIASGAKVNLVGNVATNINILDKADVPISNTETYTLIKGGANLTGALTPNFTVTGSNRFINYGLIRADNGDYIVTRTNNVANVLANDIKSNQFVNVPNMGQNITAFLNPSNTGDARAAYKNLTLAKNGSDSAKFVGALTTDENAVVTNTNLGVARDVIAQLGNRVSIVRYLGAPAGASENMLAAPEGGAVSSGNEAIDNVSYGVWIKPFYTDVHQKAKGGVAGYKARTTGGVIGLDTMANNNLMVGAAIGVTKTDIKHQDYNKGNKTDINGFAFSLYGAQQLVNNFFAQGSAVFSINHVKNKSQRYVFDTSGNMSKQIACGNYDNMTFGGNLMFGYDANVMKGVLLIPMAGLSYLKSSNEGYKETGTTFQNKQVNSKFSDRTDLIAGARVIGNTMSVSNFVLYPEAHAFIVHKVKGGLSKTQSQLDGQVQPFVNQFDKTAKTSYNLGLSVAVRPDSMAEYGIGYDAQVANKYIAHQGMLKVRVNF